MLGHCQMLGKIHVSGLAKVFLWQEGCLNSEFAWFVVWGFQWVPTEQTHAHLFCLIFDKNKIFPDVSFHKLLSSIQRGSALCIPLCLRTCYCVSAFFHRITAVGLHYFCSFWQQIAWKRKYLPLTSAGWKPFPKVSASQVWLFLDQIVIFRMLVGAADRCWGEITSCWCVEFRKSCSNSLFLIHVKAVNGNKSASAGHRLQYREKR